MLFLLIAGSVFIFTNHPYAKEEISPSQKETFQILEKLKEKTAKYKIGTYNISKNDITLDIVGSQKYYNSVKDEVKEIVKNTIKSTPFKKYSIYVNKSEINRRVSKEVLEGHRLMQEITTTIDGYLSEFYNQKNDEINLENTTTKLNIKIKTLLNGKPTNIGKEMEHNIYMDLEKKLPSNKLVREKKINISIYNKDGEKIN